MDKMDHWEIPIILSGLKQTDRNGWEQTRLQLFTLSSMFSKSEHTLQDILEFPWDETKKEHVVEMKNEDKERLKERAEAIAKILK